MFFLVLVDGNFAERFGDSEKRRTKGLTFKYGGDEEEEEEEIEKKNRATKIRLE